MSSTTPVVSNYDWGFSSDDTIDAKMTKALVRRAMTINVLVTDGIKDIQGQNNMLDEIVEEMREAREDKAKAADEDKQKFQDRLDDLKGRSDALTARSQLSFSQTQQNFQRFNLSYDEAATVRKMIYSSLRHILSQF